MVWIHVNAQLANGPACFQSHQTHRLEFTETSLELKVTHYDFVRTKRETNFKHFNIYKQKIYILTIII